MRGDRREAGGNVTQRDLKCGYRRVVSILVSLCMVFSCLPTNALANILSDEEDTAPVADLVEWDQLDTATLDEVPTPSETPENPGADVSVAPIDESISSEQVPEEPTDTSIPQDQPLEELAEGEVPAEEPPENPPEVAGPGDEGAAPDISDITGQPDAAAGAEPDPSFDSELNQGPGEEVATLSEVSDDDAIGRQVTQDLGNSGSEIIIGDQSQYISGVSIQLEPREIVNIDDILNLDLNLKFSSEVANTSLLFRYDIPDNIEFTGPALGTQQTSYDGGALALTYTIYKDHLLFQVDSTWAASHQSNMTAGFNIQLKLAGDDIRPGDKVSIDFPGVSSPIDITVAPSKLKSYKASSGISYENGIPYITYTVTLESDQFDSNVKLVDTLGEHLSFVEGSFSLDGKLFDGVAVDGNQATIMIPELSKGWHTLQYKAQVDQSLLDTIPNGSTLTPSLDNSVTWTSDNDPDGGTVGAETSAVKNLITKGDGSYNADSGVINWTIRINGGSAHQTMDGYVFTDQLAGGMTYVGSATLTNKQTGDQKTISIPENSSEFSYEFPEGSGACDYEITYTTTIPEGEAGSTFEHANDAEVRNPNRPDAPYGTDFGNITIPYPDGANLAKTVDYDEVSHIATWTVEVQPENLTAPFTVRDELKFNQWDSKNIDFNQDVVVFIDGQEIDPSNYVATYENRGQWVMGMVVDFKETDTIAAALEANKTITIVYTSTDTGDFGTYNNNAQLYKGTMNLGSSRAEYSLPITDVTTKKIGKPEWNPTYENLDGSKGAWIVPWSVFINTPPDNENPRCGINDLQGQPVTITDVLSEGQHYIAGSAAYEAWSDYDHYGHGVNGAIEPELMADGSLVFTVPTNNPELGILDDGVVTYPVAIKLTYKTAVPVREASVVKISNEVSSKAGSLDLGSDGVETDIVHSGLEKTGNQISGTNNIEYSIKVNEGAVDLLPGQDTLILEDVLDYHLSLLGSVTFEGDPAAVAACSYKVEEVDVDGKTCEKLVITIPDEAEVTVRYTVRLSGTPGENVTISNKANLSGRSELSSSVTGTFVINESSGSVAGENATITLIKADLHNPDILLSGAKFDLYRVYLQQWDDDDPTGQHPNEESGADSPYIAKVASGETNEDGTLTIDIVYPPGEAPRGLAYDVLYFFVETEAPQVIDGDGNVVGSYELDQTPHFFMLGKDPDAFERQIERAEKHGVATRDQIEANDELTVYNEKQEEPAPVRGVVQLTGTKQLDGGLLGSYDPFTFTVYNALGQKVAQGATKVSDEGSNTAPIEFTPIELTLDSLQQAVADGAATQTSSSSWEMDLVVREDEESLPPNVSMTTREIPVTVQIDNDGQGTLVTTVVYPQGTSGVEMHNRVNDAKSAVVNFSGIKKLEASGTSTTIVNMADRFSFTLTGLDGAPMPEGATGQTLTVRNDASGLVNFGNITYTMDDLAGSPYRYTVTELGTAPGVENDPESVKEIEVALVHNEQTNELECTVTPAGEGPLFSFVNRYSAWGTLELEGMKVLVGRPFAPTDVFHFAIAPVGEAPAFQNPTPEVQGVNATGNTCSFSFGSAEFTQVGTYTYRVWEQIDEESQVPGIINDPTVYVVTVTVTDPDHNGTLQCAASIQKEGAAFDEDGSSLVFQNTYAPEDAQIFLSGTKSYESAVDPEANYLQHFGRDFSFVLSSNDEGAPLPAECEKYADADGNVAFGPIVFTKDHLGVDDAGKPATESIFTYAVAEKGTHDGVTNDPASTKTVKVRVADDGTGALKAEVVLDAAAGAAADSAGFGFVNTYAAAGSLTLKGVKTIEGRNFLEGDAFEFSVETLTPEAPAFDPATVTVTQANVGDDPQSATFSFGSVTFNRVGEYQYLVSETAGDLAGMVYSPVQYLVTATVTDPNHNGTLKVEVAATVLENGEVIEGAPGFVVGEQDSATAIMSWTNSYTPEPVSAVLEASKSLVAHELVYGEEGQGGLEQVFLPIEEGQFTFALLDRDGAPVLDEAGSPVVVPVSANGDIVFPAMAYDQEGTYTYRIVELAPANTDELPGMVFDRKVVVATVEVSYNPAAGAFNDPMVSYGVLGAEGDVDDAATFTNELTTKTTISKQDAANQGTELPGATLQVVDGEGAVVLEWTSGEDPCLIEGLVPGETYTLVEVAAPEGYEVAEPIEFTVEKDGRLTEVVMLDARTPEEPEEPETPEEPEEPETPGEPETPEQPQIPERPQQPNEKIAQTGDSTNPTAAMVLGVGGGLMACTAAALLVHRRRNGGMD